MNDAPWRWRVCGLLLLATMLNYMDRLALAQSATEIGRELRLSNEDYGRLEQGFGFAFAAGVVMTGAVADRFGLRWVYPAVLLAWSMAGFATGFVTGFEGLMACRVALGFFESGQFPCGLATVQRLLPSRDRPLANSVLQGGAALGAIATALLVQALVSDVPGSWRAPFRVIGVLGTLWIVAWFALIPRGSLSRAAAGTAGAPEVSTASPGSFARRFAVLIAVVLATSLCWQFYRAWMPKMLREFYGYSRGAVNYYTTAFYVATDVGCFGAGLAARRLATRGWSVHGSRLLAFLGCALLTALGTVAAFLPAGPALLGVLLLIAAGSMGLYPIFYALSQELSPRHQGKITGSLGCIAWIANAVVQRHVGRWVDQTGSYTAVLFTLGLLPLGALVLVVAFWGPSEKPAGGEQVLAP